MKTKLVQELKINKYLQERKEKTLNYEGLKKYLNLHYFVCNFRFLVLQKIIILMFFVRECMNSFGLSTAKQS